MDHRTGPNISLALDEATWVLGFLSGVGWVHGGYLDPLNKLDAAAVLGWIDSYCAGHPLDSIAAAATAFVRAHPN